MTIRAGIYGASGYTGFELVQILMAHPDVALAFATSERNAGKILSEVFACPYDIPLVSADEAPLEQIDVAFLCLPHGTSAPFGARLVASGVRVVDLSADFRLDDPDSYARWYNVDHPAPDLLPATYGLTEVNRSHVAEADLVANPGCYPTSVLLALAPLATAGLLAPNQPVIVDSKSGVSGAGREPKLATSFVEVAGNLSPYKVGRVHRHLPEMEQELSKLVNGAGAAPDIIFTPHLLPVPRGLLSTIYVSLQDLNGTPLQDLYHGAYGDESFVDVLPEGGVATLAHVNYTNRCALSITPLGSDRAIVVSSIDNLVKGAAGQAVQNMNVMFGLPEVTGLTQ